MKKMDNRGSIPILVCLIITGLLAFTAYVIDVGMVYIERIKMSNAIDAAALAAVIELPNGDYKAKSVAQDYLQKNNVNPKMVAITISSDHKSIEIIAVKDVYHKFASVIGINSSEVSVKSEATIDSIKSINSGIRPFAIEADKFSYGDLVTLKEGAGNGYHGNYGAVALGGFGSNVFRGNALYGYNGTISIGDYIDTEPGNMAGACNEIKNFINSEHSTFNNYPSGSMRLWILPLVDSLVENGRKQVLVVGFAEFYVEEVNKSAGKIEIEGRFIKYILSSDKDNTLNSIGLYKARLSK